MDNASARFVLPLPGGNITCTEPASKIYLITFTAPPDNRLTGPFIQAFSLALDIIENRFAKGVVITTSGVPKYYSNGLDFESAMQTPNFLPEVLYPFWIRLLTYPMPTVAVVPGHAFAGGFMTAMMHDYRFMNPHRGYLCINELEFGAPLRPAMSSIFRQKLARPETYRTVVLESKRFNALESLKEGIIDGPGGLQEAITFIQEAKLTDKAESGIYGKMKEEMWRETVSYLEAGSTELGEIQARDRNRDLRKEKGLNAVRDWELSLRNGEPKL